MNQTFDIDPMNTPAEICKALKDVSESLLAELNEWVFE